MFDYIDFECNWPAYRGKDTDGNSFYLYPADVPHYEEYQFAAQSADGFFDDLISRAEAIGDSRMDELVRIVGDGRTLADKAIAERTAGRYAYDGAQDKYTLTNGEELMTEAQALYTRYAVWLENFSLSK